jgi:hypothetical protein
MNLQRLTLALLLTFFSSSTTSFSQGTVIFDTKPLGESARISLGGHGLSAGHHFFAQLYAADGLNAPESSLRPVGTPVNFRTGVNAGYVQTSGQNLLGQTVNEIVTVTSIPGGPVTIQLRAWVCDSATFEGSSYTGKSPLLNLHATGNPAGTPPTIPVELTGLQGFTSLGPPIDFATIQCVPEPSTVSLGAVAVLAFGMLRRKRVPTE